MCLDSRIFRRCVVAIFCAAAMAAAAAQAGLSVEASQVEMRREFAQIAPGSESRAKADTSERQRLAEADVKWIAAKTGWQKISLPEFQTKSNAELSTMFFGSPEGIDGGGPLALYAREQHILYLSDRLVFDNLIDRSILLHELVHHLQVTNNIQVDCREESELQAYHLQAQWLREQGAPDPYTLLGLSEPDIENLHCR